jgi:hypothetical protein
MQQKEVCRNTAVTLVSSEGQVWFYASKKAALAELGFYFIDSHVFVEFAHYRSPLFPGSLSYSWHSGRLSYVMRDDWGRPLTAEDFAHLVPKRKVGRWDHRLGSWDGKSPVPGTGKWKAGRHHFRYPRTQQERRWAEPVREEGEPGPRPARKARQLPSAWDDCSISARADRGWKRHRKTQWREKR